MTDKKKDYAERAFEREDEREMELMKGSLDSAREAIRAMLLLNGGASIALLGFLASTFSEEFTTDEATIYSAILKSLTYFAGGAFCAVLTSGLAYLVNSLYAGSSSQMKRDWDWPYLHSTPASDRRWWWGQALNWVAVATGCLSLAAFVGGLIQIASFI